MPQLRIAPLTDLPDVRGTERIAGGDGRKRRLGQFYAPAGAGSGRCILAESLASAARGERVVLGAFDHEGLIATVTLLLNLPRTSRTARKSQR